MHVLPKHVWLPLASFRSCILQQGLESAVSSVLKTLVETREVNFPNSDCGRAVLAPVVTCRGLGRSVYPCRISSTSRLPVHRQSASLRGSHLHPHNTPPRAKGGRQTLDSATCRRGPASNLANHGDKYVSLHSRSRKRNADDAKERTDFSSACAELGSRSPLPSSDAPN